MEYWKELEWMLRIGCRMENVVQPVRNEYKPVCCTVPVELDGIVLNAHSLSCRGGGGDSLPHPLIQLLSACECKFPSY